MTTWEDVLELLEADMTIAERLLAEPTEVAELSLASWEPPELDEPLPAELVERALELRARQQRTEAALTAAVGAARQQRRFADRVGQATARHPERAAYLDVNA
jgi:hypothetical protein